MSKTVAESDWIAQGKKGHGHSTSAGGAVAVHGGAGGGSGSDGLKHLGHGALHQARSTWSAEKEKVPHDCVLGAKSVNVAAHIC